jgi:acetyl esterase/lipase
MSGQQKSGIRTRLTMRVFLAVSVLSVADSNAAVWEPSPGHTQLALWPAAVPHAAPAPGPETAVMTKPDHLVAGRPFLWVENVTQPTITVYSPANANTGVAVVVFPGGGYKGLAIDLEGTEVCDWLVAKAITCVLLKYRAPDSGPHWEAKCDCHVDAVAPTALEDAQRAVGLTRFHAAEWHVDPHKIGVLGFSAGGHLVADLSTHWDRRLYPAVDAADTESCRPDFAVALYPGHLTEKTTRKYQLNPTVPVSAKTPPTFILQGVDDPVDTVDDSIVYFLALEEAGVSVELHLYAHGGHAFGLRRTKSPITHWPALVEKWLGEIKVVS